MGGASEVHTPRLSPITSPQRRAVPLEESDDGEMPQIDNTQHDDVQASPEYSTPLSPDDGVDCSNHLRELHHHLSQDVLDRVVLDRHCASYPQFLTNCIFPLLWQSETVREVVLVDVLEDEYIIRACAVAARNPNVVSFVVLRTREDELSLSLDGIAAISSLIRVSPSLQSLSLMNCLHRIAPQAMVAIGEAIPCSYALRKLNLEANNIQDQDLLPLAQALAEPNPIMEVTLDHNRLFHPGLEMLSEVMTYNDRLVNVSISGNFVRCITDTWEGFFIQEQCSVNREMMRLGHYTMKHHAVWPSLWRRKMRWLWYVQKKSGKVDEELWEDVLQYLNPRAYVEQQVKLWMKVHPVHQVEAQPNWRHT